MRKYLAYALGEILLVAIGILLALQVNNWNQKRLLKTKEKALLTELRENLKASIVNLETISQQQRKIINDASLLIAHLDAKKPYSDTLDVYFSNVFYVEPFNISTSAYETIKSQGLDIISSTKLKSLVYDLYDIHYADQKALVEKIQTSFINNNAVPNDLVWRFDGPRTSPVDYGRLINEPQYLSYLSARKKWKTDFTELMCADLIRLMKELIIAIDTELDVTIETQD